MLAAGPVAVLLLVLLPSAATPPAGCELVAQGLEGVTASLYVHVAERGPAPGLGEVELTLKVTGGPGLEVEKPRVEDPTESWKIEPATPTQKRTGDTVTWSQVFVLRQSRPGPVELPLVKVRVRADPDAPWQTAEWSDILRQVLNPASIPTPPAAPARSRWLLPALAVGLALLLAAAWIVYRRRRTGPGPLRPEQRALRELERLEAAGLTEGVDVAGYHAQLADVVRRYLEECFGLHASRQTTSDLVASLGTSPLTDEQRELLRSFLERCDLVKFARASSSPEECQTALAMARALIVQTIPPEAGDSQPSGGKLFRTGRRARNQEEGKVGGGG